MEVKVNTFTEFTLTEEEVVLSQGLSILNRAFIQNLRAAVAQEILNLEYDPEKPMEFLRQKVYKDGQLSMLSYLLDCSEAVVFNPPESTEE